MTGQSSIRGLKKNIGCLVRLPSQRSGPVRHSGQVSFVCHRRFGIQKIKQCLKYASGLGVAKAACSGFGSGGGLYQSCKVSARTHFPSCLGLNAALPIHERSLATTLSSQFWGRRWPKFFSDATWLYKKKEFEHKEMATSLSLAFSFSRKAIALPVCNTVPCSSSVTSPALDHFFHFPTSQCRKTLTWACCHTIKQKQTTHDQLLLAIVHNTMAHGSKSQQN